MPLGKAEAETPETEASTKKKKKTPKGIGWFMDNPYVDYWPTERTIDEAATWCKKDWGLNKTVEMPC